MISFTSSCFFTDSALSYSRIIFHATSLVPRAVSVRSTYGIRSAGSTYLLVHYFRICPPLLTTLWLAICTCSTLTAVCTSNFCNVNAFCASRLMRRDGATFVPPTLTSRPVTSLLTVIGVADFTMTAGPMPLGFPWSCVLNVRSYLNHVIFIPFIQRHVALRRRLVCFVALRVVEQEDQNQTSEPPCPEHHILIVNVASVAGVHKSSGSVTVSLSSPRHAQNIHRRKNIWKEISEKYNNISNKFYSLGIWSIFYLCPVMGSWKQFSEISILVSGTIILHNRGTPR